MAVKTQKQAVETTTPPEAVAQSDLESAIADELLENIDWSKVKTLMISKAPARLFAWLAGGNDRPINISQFPELAALPSSTDDEDKAS